MNIILTTPLALLSLLSLPVIAALHMLRARSQAYPVSSLQLWKFLNPQLSGTAARRLPITWLLLIDLLIAALLCFALAGPQLDLTRTVREGRHLVLLLDTSISMAAGDETPDRIHAAANDLIPFALGPEQDAVTIITFSRGASTFADSRSPDFQSRLEELHSLRPDGPGNGLDEALALARASLDPELPAEIHIFTDAAYPSPDLSGSELPITWHVYGRSGNNQAVLSVRAESLSELKHQVFVRAANFSEESVTRSLVVSADGLALPPYEITFSPDSSTALTFEIIGRAQRITARLEGTDDLDIDDAGFTVLNPYTTADVEIALVTSRPGPLQRALEAVPHTAIQVIAPEDYLPGSPFDLVVFQGSLPDRWPGSVVLVVEPPAVSGLLGEASLVRISEMPVPQPDEILADIDFTGVRWSSAWQIGKIPTGVAGILQSGKTPILLRGQQGLSELVLLLAETSDAEGTPTAFARHPAFPTLIANIVQLAADEPFPSDSTLGSPIALPKPDRYPSLSIVLPDERIIRWDGDRPAYWHDATQAGFYTFSLTDLEGLETSVSMGVSAGDLRESRIAPGNWPSEIETPPPPSASSDQPVSLVPWLLAAAAVLFFPEAWLAWRTS